MKLNEICEVYSGYALKAFNDAEDGLPVVKIGNILTDGTLNLEECQYTTDSVNEKYYSQRGDIYIALSGATTGKIGIMDTGDQYVINQRVGIVRQKSDDVPQEYIKYFLLRQTDRILQEAAGCAQPNISPKQIAEYVIPDTSQEKMQEICEVLDRIKKIVDSRKAEISALDDLIKARFAENFGDMYLNTLSWREVQLETVADIASGITKGRKIKEQKLIEVPYMAVSNVKDGYIDWTAIKTIEATEQEIEQYRLLPDDVLMTEGGDPDKVGRGAIIRKPLENCIHQNHIFRVRLNEKLILPSFFAEYLQHQRSKRYFLGCAKQTTGIASINMKQLRALPVLLPSLDLQQQFSDFVKATDKSKAVVQKSLEETQLLFDSLMQKYFG